MSSVYLKKILNVVWPSNLLTPQPQIDVWVIEKLSGLPNGSRILDAGAGTQPYKKFCDHLEYVSQDFGEYNGYGDGAGLQEKGFSYNDLHIVCDICSVPEADASFDAVLCTEVFEHIPDPVSALKELFRLLKPRGLLILTAPFCSLTHFSPFHFASGFNSYWWKYWLQKINFSEFIVTSYGGFFDFIAQLLKITPSITLKYSRKRFISFLLMPISFIQILLLSFAKTKKDNSNELVCFGYFIYAKK